MIVRKIGHALLRLTRDLTGDRSGGVLIYTAIVAPTLLGFTGLSVDVGLWQANKRVVQAAADAAAIAGVLNVFILSPPENRGGSGFRREPGGWHPASYAMLAPMFPVVKAVAVNSDRSVGP